MEIGRQQADENFRNSISLGPFGLRARTKQFIESGLKITFIPCSLHKNVHKNTCKLLHIKLSHSNN